MKISVLVLLAGAVAIMTAPKTSAADSPDDIIVFVNNAVPVDQMNIDDVKNLFLKRKLRWGTGGKVIPIHAKPATVLRSDFLRRACNMSLKQEESYWNDARIRKGVSMPAELAPFKRPCLK